MIHCMQVRRQNANQCHTLHAYYNIIIMQQHLAMGVGLYSLECDMKHTCTSPFLCNVLLHTQSTHITIYTHDLRSTQIMFR